MTVFSCDLVSNAKKHLQFLQEMHVYNQATFVVTSTVSSPPPHQPQLLHLPPSAQEIEALRRYEMLWLPLVIANAKDRLHPTTDSSSSLSSSSLPLIPPPDIAWLWHCHRLAPQQYRQYFGNVEQKTSRGQNDCSAARHVVVVVDAHPPFTFVSPEYDMKSSTTTTKTNDPSFDAMIARTKGLWKQSYPHESFYLTDTFYESSSDSNDDQRKTKKNQNEHMIRPLIHGFDLIGSARRQTTFLWQVSGEQYHNDTFLQEGVQKYQQFLQLTPRAKQLNIVLVPTYQIDLMWHTHILSSVNDYNTDCIRIMNCTMYHDDSLDDREEGGILDVSYTATQKLWKSVYNTDYKVNGGMYRGEPPLEYFHGTWSRTSADTPAVPNHHYRHLIGMVGASSTAAAKIFSLTPPKPWIKVYESTSDGSPAFIRTSEQTRKALSGKALPHLNNYVFGRFSRTTGYYHIETKEAYMILYYRISHRLSTMKTAMMTDMCSCGLGNNKKQRTTNMEKYEKLKMVYEALRGQIFPPNISSFNTMTPDKLYECAGGSCGGTVALNGGQGTFFQWL